MLTNNKQVVAAVRKDAACQYKMTVAYFRYVSLRTTRFTESASDPSMGQPLVDGWSKTKRAYCTVVGMQCIDGDHLCNGE